MVESGGKVKKKAVAKGSVFAKATTDRSEDKLAGDIEKQRERLQDFVYIVSHDLGSPLFSIEAFSVELGRSCEKLRQILDGGQVGRGIKDKAVSVLDGDVEGALDYIRQPRQKTYPSPLSIPHTLLQSHQ